MDDTMTAKDYESFEQDFKDFIQKSIEKYQPGEVDLEIMYTSMLVKISTRMKEWALTERKNEEWLW